MLSRILTAPLMFLRMEDHKYVTNVEKASIYQPTEIVLLKKQDAYIGVANASAVLLPLSMIQTIKSAKF